MILKEKKENPGGELHWISFHCFKSWRAFKIVILCHSLKYKRHKISLSPRKIQASEIRESEDQDNSK